MKEKASKEWTLFYTKKAMGRLELFKPPVDHYATLGEAVLNWSPAKKTTTINGETVKALFWANMGGYVAWVWDAELGGFRSGLQGNIPIHDKVGDFFGEENNKPKAENSPDVARKIWEKNKGVFKECGQEGNYGEGVSPKNKTDTPVKQNKDKDEDPVDLAKKTFERDKEFIFRKFGGDAKEEDFSLSSFMANHSNDPHPSTREDQWEYDIIRVRPVIEKNAYDFTKFFDNMGKNGWELVGITKRHLPPSEEWKAEYTCFFKRRKIRKQPKPIFSDIDGKITCPWCKNKIPGHNLQAHIHKCKKKPGNEDA